MRKLIKSIIFMPFAVLTGCSSVQSNVSQTSLTNANFVYDKNQYYYCSSESCITPTTLEPYTVEDFKPLEPDYVPPIVIVNNDHKIHHKKRKIRKRLKKNPKQTKTITKCFIVNKNESGAVVISGNKLLPVQSGDEKTMQFLESSTISKLSK